MKNFPLSTAAVLVEAIQRLVAERRRVEIYFHPGIDPDAEAASRLLYRWAMILGAEDVRVFHFGKPHHLSSVEPVLEAQDLSEGALFNAKLAPEVVTIVVDVSNMSFLTNGDSELLDRMLEPDFVIDHHFPPCSEIKKEDGLACGGRLVLPSLQCSALLVDRLMLMADGHSQHLSKEPELAGLVVAAALTDCGLESKDEKPEWFPANLWSRLQEIRSVADASVIAKHTVQPWREESYLEWELEALKGLEVVTVTGSQAVYCWLGTLELHQKSWIGHFADVLQQQRERVRRHVPEEPTFTCVMAAIKDPRALAASVRSQNGYSADQIMRMLHSSGGGRSTAAAAMLLKRDYPDSPDDLVQWGQETLQDWRRRSKQVIRNALSKSPPDDTPDA